MSVTVSLEVKLPVLVQFVALEWFGERGVSSH